MFCPKCGSKYKCPCGSCEKTDKWAFIDDNIRCLTCDFEESHDWWFDLEMTLHRKEMHETKIAAK